MIDLDAIKHRHLDPERMKGRTYYQGHLELDLAALVEEVERLRGEAAKERTAEEDLVRVLRRVLDENKLREAHGEDTLGVLMKCGAFHDTEVAALATRIDAVEL